MSSSAKSDIVIAGIGMATPVGLCVNDTYYSVYAGESRFQEIHIVDARLRNMIVSSIPNDCLVFQPLADELRNPLGTLERSFSLYSVACEDIKKQLNSKVLGQSFPLYFGLPSQMFNEETTKHIVRLSADIGLNIPYTTAIEEGRASSLIALYQAVLSIQKGESLGAYVAGCDSYINPRVLYDLDQQQRLKTSENSNGFIPGEGAGILFVTTQAFAEQFNCPVYARLLAANEGFEEGHLKSDAAYNGDGLATCVTELFEQVSSNSAVNQIYTSMNGEDYWLKEWQTTYIRNKERFSEEVAINHPAEFFGDVGAASGVLLTGLVAFAQHQNHIYSQTLVYTSSDAGKRCAVLLA